MPLKLNYTVNSGLKVVDLIPFISFFESSYGPPCGVTGFELRKITYESGEIYENRMNMFYVQNEGRELVIDTS